MALKLPQVDDLSSEPAATVFPWLARPCDAVPLNDLEAVAEAANAYFTECFEKAEQPKLTGLALALGLTGPAALTRFAQRRPELRWVVSRCLTAVAHGYEQMIQDGKTQGAIFMLKHLPEFDLLEPEGSKPVQYFHEKRELVLEARVAGVRRPHDEGAELTPRESYLRLVRGGEDVYEDVIEAPDQAKVAEKVETLQELLSGEAPSDD